MTDEERSKLRTEVRDPTTIPPNPDLSEDLDYDLIDLDVITTDDPYQQVLVLPKDEDMLHEDMFLVADPEGVVDLIDWV